MSKIWTLIFILTSLFVLHTQAQTSDEAISSDAAINVLPLTEETILPGTYKIASERIFKVNDQTFFQYTLEPNFAPSSLTQPLQFNNGLNCTSLNLDLDNRDYNRKINLDRTLLLTNLVGTAAAGYGVYAVNPQYDKVRHFLAGYVIANGTNAAFQLILPKDMKHRKLVTFMAGFGASVIVGVGKEVRDSYGYGHPSTMDAVATAAGGLAGTLTINVVDIQNAFKKKKPIVRE